MTIDLYIISKAEPVDTIREHYSGYAIIRLYINENLTVGMNLLMKDSFIGMDGLW